MRFSNHFIYFRFNKDLTVIFAPIFWVMTSPYEAVVSLTVNFFKIRPYKVRTKTHKASMSLRKPFGSDFEKIEGEVI